MNVRDRDVLVRGRDTNLEAWSVRDCGWSGRDFAWSAHSTCQPSKFVSRPRTITSRPRKSHPDRPVPCPNPKVPLSKTTIPHGNPRVPSNIRGFPGQTLGWNTAAGNTAPKQQTCVREPALHPSGVPFASAPLSLVPPPPGRRFARPWPAPLGAAAAPPAGQARAARAE
eukprot:gene23966-biopygen10405